jgi:uncharacterized protein (DUF2267 family)
MKKSEFLAKVQKLGGLGSPTDAERWSTTTVRALAQLAPEPEQRRHFISQLPGFLKSPLHDEPPAPLLMDRDAFVQHLAAELGTHAPDGERALRAVYQVLKEAVSPGQIAEFEAHIPKDIAAFLERAGLTG